MHGPRGAAMAAVLLVSLSLQQQAAARSWQVGQDGMGDFSVIQDAVDAAASGDTIRIGPGRYDDGETITTPGWTEFVRVVVRQEELTIIGAGNGSTIIGPDDPWSLSDGDNRGIEYGTWWGNERLSISGIQFENMAFAINGAPGSELIVGDCSFNGNNYSVFSYQGSTKIYSSTFEFMPRDGAMVHSHSDSSLLVQDCRFRLDDVHQWNQKAMHVQNCLNASIENCSFIDGAFGMQLLGVPVAEVENCSLTGQSDRAIVCMGGNFSISDCIMENLEYGVFVSSPHSNISMHGTSMFDVAQASFLFDTIGEVTVNDCILAKGATCTVWQFLCAKDDELPHLDFTNNDWGTSCADSIAAWISVCDYVVDYVPFQGQSVPAESASFGDVKAMYLGER